MATTTVNGVELYYQTTGTGDCLVLTHGSWTDGTGWDRAVGGLAERYQVVVWDRRGHSRSQAGDGPGSRAEDAADLAGLIETVCGAPVHVAGSSYGGIVTLTLLTNAPTWSPPPRSTSRRCGTSSRDARSGSCQRASGCRRRPRGGAEPHQLGAPPRRCRTLHRARGPGAGHVGSAPEAVPGGSGGQRPHLPRRAGRPDSRVDRHRRAGQNLGASPADARHREPRAVPCRDRRAREAGSRGASGSLDGAGHIPTPPTRRTGSLASRLSTGSIATATTRSVHDLDRPSRLWHGWRHQRRQRDRRVQAAAVGPSSWSIWRR